MESKMDKTLKVLGVVWSVIAFIVIAAFFFGGEWNDWKEIKRKVLVEDSATNSLSVSGIEISNGQLNKLKGNLEVPENRWDGDPTSIRVHENVKYCPEGWYVVGMRGIDTDNGGYCSSCISDIEFVCRKL